MDDQIDAYWVVAIEASTMFDQGWIVTEHFQPWLAVAI